MSTTPSPFWLYDLHGRPQYSAYGDYSSLLNDVVFFRGMRGLCEKAWLEVQKIYPRDEIKDHQQLNAWKKLSTSLQQNIKSTLLWRTDWYKSTLFVGGVTTEDRRFFVKVYRRPDETILAVHQASFIAYYFGSHFTTVQPAHYDDSVIFYPLLPHKNTPLDSKSISNKLIQIALDYHQLFSANTKPVMDYINLNLPSLLQKQGRIDLWQSVRQALSSLPAIPSIPVHGDMMPWNIFNSDHALPVLVDYERAGWQTTFYDWWHFHCQPDVMAYKLPDILKLAKDLQNASAFDMLFILQTGLLYMLDQLAYDLQDQDDYPKQKSRLDHTIKLKLKAAEILLEQLQRHVAKD